MRRGLGGGKLLALPEKMVDGRAHVKEDKEKDDGDLGEVWRLLYMHITFFFFSFFFFIYAKGPLCLSLKEFKNQFCA